MDRSDSVHSILGNVGRAPWRAMLENLQILFAGEQKRARDGVVDGRTDPSIVRRGIIVERHVRFAALPAAPTDVSISEVTATAVHLEWSYKGPEDLQYYVIQYKRKNANQVSGGKRWVDERSDRAQLASSLAQERNC